MIKELNIDEMKNPKMAVCFRGDGGEVIDKDISPNPFPQPGLVSYIHEETLVMVPLDNVDYVRFYEGG